MIKTMHRMACAYGHEWSSVMTLAEAFGHETDDALRATFEAHPDRGEWPGVGPAVSHLTMTGRTAWSVNAYVNKMEITVARKFPDGAGVNDCGGVDVISINIDFADGEVDLEIATGGPEWARAEDRHRDAAFVALTAACGGGSLRLLDAYQEAARQLAPPALLSEEWGVMAPSRVAFGPPMTDHPEQSARISVDGVVMAALASCGTVDWLVHSPDGWRYYGIPQDRAV